MLFLTTPITAAGTLRPNVGTALTEIDKNINKIKLLYGTN
jgi:hypothetical protein